MYSISRIFIYPVKSLSGFEVNEAMLTDRGLQYDRRWMLVNQNNYFLTQREYPQMSLLQTAIEQNELIIYHKHNPADKIHIPVNGANDKDIVPVHIWEDECMAVPVSKEADEWFTKQLSISCRLVYMPETTLRKVDPKYATPTDVVAFSDAYPLMIIGEASLNDLNNRLHEPVSIERFRPNIFFAGGKPYSEDRMEHITINDINIYGVKLCARCTIPTVNPSTAEKGKEPLRTLATYRTKDNKIYFGQNVLHKQTGLIKKGDRIEVISTKELIHF